MTIGMGGIGAAFGWRLGMAALCALTVVQLSASSARAQSLKDLSGALGGATGGGGALPSVEQASPSNLVGVLQYCVKNKYLGGGDASMGSSVLGKLTGTGQTKDASAFKAGSGGLLETGGGQSFGLGGGIKEKVTEQVCDLVLKHAQSLL
jgi:hypothetical protein